MVREKITGAVTSAINHLESSMKALVNRNEKEVMGSVWRAAADLEYALLLFSLIKREEFEGSPSKLDLHLKRDDIGPVLLSAQDLLKEAKSDVDSGRLREAHEKTWVARGHLLKIQEMFEKRRRSRGKSILPL